MFKNKDGSYNKLQLLLISLIAVIGIGIFVLSIAPDIQNINVEDLFQIIKYILIIIATILAIIALSKLFVSNKKTVEPPIINKPLEVKPIPIAKIPENVDQKLISEKNKILKKINQQSNKNLTTDNEKYKSKSGSGINMVSMLITLVVAGGVMMVGINILNSMISAMPELPAGSQFSTQAIDITNTMSTAFNFLAFGMFVLIGIFVIIGLVSSMMGMEKY